MERGARLLESGAKEERIWGVSGTRRRGAVLRQFCGYTCDVDTIASHSNGDLKRRFEIRNIDMKK